MSQEDLTSLPTDSYDSIAELYPLKIAAIRQLKSGILPLWNPYIYCGMPLYADSQTLPFLFTNFIFFLVSNEAYAYTLYLIFNLFFIGLFTYLFLKELKLEFYAAIFGSLVFTFSLHHIVRLPHPWITGTNIFLPLSLFLLERAINKNSKITFIALSLVTGYMFIAGCIQSNAIVFLFWLAYLLLRLFFLDGSLPYKPKIGFKIIIFYILGLLLGAVVILPTMELIRYSWRANIAQSYFSLGINKYPLVHFITAIFPEIFGNPVDGFYIGRVNFTEGCIYIGFLPLIFSALAIGAYRAKRKTVPWISLIALVFGIFFIFRFDFLSLIFYRFIPLMKTFYIPRFTFIYTFSASVLCAFGLEAFIRKELDYRMFRRILNIFFIIISIVSLIFVANYLNLIFNIFNYLPYAGTLLKSFILHSSGSHITWQANIDSQLKDLFASFFLRKSLYLDFLFCLIALFIIRILFNAKFPRKLALPVIFCIYLLDIFYFGYKYTNFQPRSSAFPATGLTSFLEGKTDHFRIVGVRKYRYAGIVRPGRWVNREGNFIKNDIYILPFDTAIPYNIESCLGYGSLYPKWYAEVAAYLLNDGQYLGGEVSSFKNNSRFYDLFNVGYILSSEVISDNNLDLLKKIDGVFIYKNKNALPRVYWVPQAVPFTTIRESLEFLNSSRFAPAKMAAVNDPFEKYIPECEAPNDNGGGVNLKIVEHKPGKILIDIYAEKNGYLIFNEAYFPGWRAYIDTKEKKILLANGLVKCVFIPNGKHTVEFKYLPQSFIIGGCLTLFALIILIIIALL
ncbi:MAG: YfhO family protein [Candidatus Omnitrophica bacterium]|nr:YfhO family protein [Candidatus Omnitrophota bacterium]